jgi:hypothetical protein
MSDERLTLYLDSDLKESIELQADRSGQSQNEWVRDACRRKIKAERQESALEATNAEQRLEALIQQVADEVDEVTQGYRDLMAKTGVYTIANWELIKRDYSDVQRRQVLETGRQRLLDQPGDPNIQQQNTDAQQQQQDSNDLTPPSSHRDDDDDEDNPLRG